ncbi:MAG: sigma 54-interacting transcriptional regulator [Desulfobacteraceae bacterium]|jgi:PAS domain S-box-containing protein
MKFKSLGVQGGRSQDQAVDNSDSSAQIRQLRQQLEIYQLIFDSIHNGAIVTDASGKVTHFNKPYGRFLGIDPDNQIGRHCTEVLDNTRMHVVAKTGKPEINRTHEVKGQNMVVQRIPIFKDGKVVAVFGQVMFKDVRDVQKLAREFKLLESKVQLYEEELLNLRATRYTLESIKGKSDAIAALKKEALHAAGSKSPVLVSGESGTGKELFAQAIHQAGERKLYPFVRINCAAIPKDLLESELFGYEKGAFTGARPGGKPGKFELAHQGTIFLDEIGDLPMEMQPKLLRVLEDKEFERVGGNHVIRSDFRLIAASNQPLEEMLEKGVFRKDLFYRLNVIRLHIPPLRERREDIIELSQHLLELLTRDANLPMPAIDAEARRALIGYDWPGNVRELSNALERSLASMEGRMIRLTDLPFHIHQKGQGHKGGKPASIREVQQKAEKEAIQYALKVCGYNKSQAARHLGIHRTLLYKKMKKYKISMDPIQ